MTETYRGNKLFIHKNNTFTSRLNYTSDFGYNTLQRLMMNYKFQDSIGKLMYLKNQYWAYSRWINMSFFMHTLYSNLCIYFSQFRMSWPTGLFLQVNPSFKDEILMDPITISQRYLPRPMSPHLNSIRDESWRVYTRSGIVYRFMQDSSVQILCSNGTIFNCKTFYYDSWDNLQ